jgi:transcriptional regulator with XRE-family HTH domain
MADEERHHFLKEWREHMQMNQSEFAQYVGMSTSNYNSLELGRIKYTQDSLEKIARKLEVLPAELLSRNPLEPETFHEEDRDTLEWRVMDAFSGLKHSNQLLALDLINALGKHELRGFMPNSRSRKDLSGESA